MSIHKVTITATNFLKLDGHEYRPGDKIPPAAWDWTAEGSRVAIERRQVRIEPAGDGDAPAGDAPEPTLAELREQAKAAGITGYSRMSKAELQEALDDAQG